MNKSEEKYGLFNGRRSADNYVKAWLKAVTVICGISLTVGLTFAGWLTSKIYHHETRIIKIEASMFTYDDAVTLMTKLQDDLRGIRVEIAKLPKQAPPQWLRDMVMQNQSDVRELRKVK